MILKLLQVVLELVDRGTLLVIVTMKSPLVVRELAALSELERAEVAGVRFLAGMSVLVLLQILWQTEVLRTVLARETLLRVMFLVVSFERELRLEGRLAAEDVTDEELLILLINLFYWCRSLAAGWLDKRVKSSKLHSVCVHFD